MAVATLSSATGSGYSFVPDPASPMSSMDLALDPITGDFIRTDDGEWLEEAGCRTMMLLMLEIELGASPFDPNDGTSLKTLRRLGDPITPETIRSETRRAAEILQAAGHIADLDVQIRDASGKVLRDQTGRTTVQTSWRDLASGSDLDLVIQAG